MRFAFKNLILFMIILLISPVIFYISGWHWDPEQAYHGVECFYFLTESAGAPWGVITCVVLAVWFCFCLKLNKEQIIKLIIILVLTILIGQAIKTLLKELWAESRPFVVWLENIYHIKDPLFYSLPRSQRAAMIATYLHDSPIIPSWLFHYWQRETGYAFPSGHAIFSATWALLGSVLLWQKRCYITVVILVIWQILVAISRLLLGMHWPVDLMLGIVLSAIFAGIAYFFVRKWIPNMFQ